MKILKLEQIIVELEDEDLVGIVNREDRHRPLQGMGSNIMFYVKSNGDVYFSTEDINSAKNFTLQIYDRVRVADLDIDKRIKWVPYKSLKEN